MPAVSSRTCKYCDRPARRTYAKNGRFKGYNKTCGAKECLRPRGNPAPYLVGKTCEHCEQEFVGGVRARWCKTCVPHGRARDMLVRYGLSWPQYLMAVADPCPLCGRPATVIDHDHVTGRTRAALCNGCNVALARLETQGWVERANEYLEEHACQQ